MVSNNEFFLTIGFILLYIILMIKWKIFLEKELSKVQSIAKLKGFTKFQFYLFIGLGGGILFLRK